ncbi:type I DNA topoisomerase [Acaryochloris sp. CCMEE 5410]|uniref:type I DNA topoisomerase n=1 Tax=Acaryochloris sp. CCMEE 5410 TaxID=310037 RepID=UPI0002484574|nr:type I DNA topoisomerase [Acaryochloris sp. CCMEE 5410]KAI9133121.1 type I DNA topoisomerase [Acaryochloris sp. CCMEE 5410]
MSRLLIVESPGKIKKLRSILGSGWQVRASIGHIRQLANTGTGNLGFEAKNGQITCSYEPRDDRAKKTIADLKTAAKQADEIFIASDPDREGEVIGWHIAQVLGIKKPKRVVYQEITERAVRQAIAHPKSLDMDLVEAGRCRDCLDKLVGYRGSPLVWRLNNGAKSVGRVQSATLHLICQREREIQVFVPQDYWSVFVEYAEGFKAFYHGSMTGSESDETTIEDAGSEAKTEESTRVTSQAAADALVEIAQTHPHQILSIEGKITPKKPPAPFTTSALQQAAGSRLKFSPEQTMQVAQKLYEAGLITYMRTDSVILSPDYCAAAKKWLEQNDVDNVPKKVAKQKGGKQTQEGHEAIRPTDIFKPSAELKQTLPEDQFKLYVLIWTRALASQCKPAQIRKTIVISQSGEVQWKAKGNLVEFKGYSKYWKDIKADTELPTLQPQQSLTLVQADSQQKQTQPPARYSEPKLVQLMEKKGIGRPSTYAPTIKTIKARGYVDLIKGKLQPTQIGMEVDQFMGGALPELLEAEFTAQMESSLDAIAQGHQEWQNYLIDWNRSYFAPALAKALKELPEPTSNYGDKVLQKSRTKCPGCSHPMSKVPSKKVKKKYFLKCENGCTADDGRGLVMFWSDRGKNWQVPQAKSDQPAPPAELTDYPCPACQQKMEIYSYHKDEQTKQMLRCSDPKARSDKKHKNAVYFQSKGRWWSPKYGELE